jgi:arylsulfatase A-like enzyme
MDRRSFLKIAGLTSSLLLLPKLTAWAGQNAGLPNIIIMVLDAMSAKNLSVYGYPRRTTPNLERFAQRATVYHSHYSGGNFTPPGTASLLSGMYPWTHRAINISGIIKRSLIGNDVFTMLGDRYTRVAFPQNFWVDFILTQFGDQINTLLPTGSFSELDFLLSQYFPNDANIAARALDGFVFKGGGERSTTLLMTPIERALYSAKRYKLPNEEYPREIPYLDDYPVHFKLEKVFAGMMSVIQNLQTPFFTYLHMLPPHAPYTPTVAFNDIFKRDGVDATFIKKPMGRFARGKSESELLKNRLKYDQYIATTDREIGNFLDALENSELANNTYVFITSDHGEMFERGEMAHITSMLYEPVVRIPLLVLSPGQKTRRDVYTPTSAVDIVPTIAQLTGSAVPSATEGIPLPGLGGPAEDSERSLYIVEAKTNPAREVLKKATIALRKGSQKLIYYTGYTDEDIFELYDIEDDPEEMRDLFPEKSAAAKRMKDELLEAFHAANKPYMK